jgi:hypothetical protein
LVKTINKIIFLFFIYNVIFFNCEQVFRARAKLLWPGAQITVPFDHYLSFFPLLPMPSNHYFLSL